MYSLLRSGEQKRRLIDLWLNIWRLNRKHNMIKRVNIFLLVRRIYPNVSGSFKKWYKCRYREIHIHQQIHKNTHFLVSFVLLSWKKVICIIRRHFQSPGVIRLLLMLFLPRDTIVRLWWPNWISSTTLSNTNTKITSNINTNITSIYKYKNNINIQIQT